jgi:hypothetical protein
MKKKFSEISVGVKFIDKDGEWKKVGRTTALCIFSARFPQHEGKVVGGFAKNFNIIVKPTEDQ